jgi:Flp pilus assembly protein TadG
VRTSRAVTGVRRRLGVGTRADDGGNAIVEFVYLAVLLMVPLVYVLLTVFKVQAAAYAVSSAAREAGRVYATSTDLDDAGPRAFAAANLVMADSDISLRPTDVSITCSSRPCLQPGSQVNVVLRYQVPLPFLPRFLAGGAPASVQVTSRHLEVVDRYRQAAR